MSTTEVARAAFRKFVYRRATMGFYEGAAAEVRPIVSSGFRMQVMEGRHVDADAIGNPHLSESDIEAFRRHPAAACVIAWDGSEVAGSTWMLQGRALVPELGREIDLDDNQHYSCRSHVHPSNRGHGLLAAMIYEYSSRQSTDAQICGLVYDWNKASIRSIENLGWTRTGTYWSVWIFGIRLSGQRSFVGPADPCTTP